MTASLDDLRALRGLVVHDGGRLLDDEQERLLEFVDTAIRVRVAQKTKSRTAWHAERLDAFHAARARWRQRCEEHAIGHATETIEFREIHPMPRLRDFMTGDRPDDICPLCGAPLTQENE